MKLIELLQDLRGITPVKKEEELIQIEHLEMDSRLVENNTLFFCINGYTVDGHDFAKMAQEKGAVAIIAERPLPLSIPVIVVPDTKRAMAKLANRFYDEPTKKLQLIGVTGTNGKTSVTHILDQIFRDANQKTGLIGTMYTKIGDEVIETKNTTPESLVLQQRFHSMHEHGVETALMEVSSHALHLGRVRGCDFNTAIFTNLTPDHIDYHETMDHYLYAKSLLFSQLGNTYEGKCAIINADDPASDRLIHMTTADIITYGMKKKVDVQAKDVKVTAAGTSFKLVVFGESIHVQLKLIGLFNVYNTLAAAAAAYNSGLTLKQIKGSLEQLTGIAGRFEPVDAGQDFTVIVDYAHTPDSLENVLQTVQEFAENQVRVVVGCGGDRDASKRPVMGRIAVQYADETIFTSDNPRTEEPSAILADMTAALDQDQYQMIEDRKLAIEYAIKQAQPGDIILIAGKGHETYQEIGRERIHFDDREVAQAVLKERVQ
ncbi:UDP-N-acetylmuramoylalanyl-D-glutamate-2,6-diaminopimelate ligase [Bacillus sp. JCM 19046]|uniref:UDP-N-acetylmuramoyl-L-alanyl-D-glutamate--2,6-diaminopimelate ligase n=1 Tax=Shouchella xiaoxiensis TaxID=766895 RepID=A0ABS2SPW4_9BACI|nr:UDP-N-acetylmuramoyl-L-alanyl-D-glutamate--2,6-diaminopimelate ligase [Shouchella xiaoxiensis]MBM7837554.1 UDP-N-acetylmuramoyl-L-alanyl-D-glutamate--2,6-diaminopimelate ligase [Shouchella xiaoxiensis]GAF16477.1 UDP-N-acetylmuramoylalanyl-D-glutamate-2,6-diaminopimelate ligase [Bacillus sp. JCM 19046]